MRPNGLEFGVVVRWWRGEQTGSELVTSGNALEPAAHTPFPQACPQLAIFGRCAEVGTGGSCGAYTGS